MSSRYDAEFIRRQLERLANSRIYLLAIYEYGGDVGELRRDLLQEGWLGFLQVMSAKVRFPYVFPGVARMCPPETPQDILRALSHATRIMGALSSREQRFDRRFPDRGNEEYDSDVDMRSSIFPQCYEFNPDDF